MTTQTSLTGIDTLTRLSEYGFKFVLVTGRTKRVTYDGWQNPRNAKTLQQAIDHYKRNNNVGALCGQGLGMLDLDRPPVTYPDFCQKYPELARTPALIRRNATNKAKLIFRIKTKPGAEFPPGRKYSLPDESDPDQKLKTVVEWLSTGNQGVVAGLNTMAAPVEIELINHQHPPVELTPTQLYDLWQELTGQDFIGDTPPATKPKPELPQFVVDDNPLKIWAAYCDYVDLLYPPEIGQKLKRAAVSIVEQIGDQEPLKTLSIAELMTTDWPEPVWAIPGLLPVGLTILAGKPKLGKSWLLLQLAHAVAAAKPLFDTQLVEPGRVLYLALEDNARRLQDRIKRQGWTWQGLDIDFVTMAEFKNRMGSFLDGGAESLARQMESSRYNLVIVDTLSRACFNDPNRNELMAATLAPVQELAMSSNTALLFVDHHNKSAGHLMDAIGDILGGTSKGATLDTAWGLYKERGKSEANLAITGRDVDELNLMLDFDKLTGRWQYLGDYYALKITERRQEYLDIISDLEGSAQAPEVAKNLGVTVQAARQQLNELAAGGYLQKVKEGRLVFYKIL